MKKNHLLRMAITAFAGLTLAACGNNDATDATDTTDNAGSDDFTIGLVTDLGSVNDKSFNQNAWEGLQRLEEEFGYNVSFLEPRADGDVETNLLQFVNSGADLTWASAATLADPVKNIAENNPDTMMAVVDSDLEGIDNVVSVSFKENEGAFLAGVAAGSMTKTNKLGFIGGMKIPVIQRFQAGFEAGAKAVNPEIEVIANYVGVFTRVDMGKSAAATIYNDGADIIFHASGATGNGIFNEAQERFDNGEQVWVIGVDKDQSLEFGNDITLTSMMKHVERAVYDISKLAAEGNFPGGEVVRLGIKEDGVGLAETSDINLPADVLELVEEYKVKIANGEIDIPETP